MAMLLYFPGVRGASDDHLRAAGLADLVTKTPGGPDEPGPEWTEVLGRGPDGGRGMVCCWRTGDPALDPSPFGVALDRQTWKPVPSNAAKGLAAGRYWIGVESGRPVAPLALQRKGRYPGTPVKLLDGQEWIIPRAQAMPHRHGLNANGEHERRAVAAFEWFVAEAQRYSQIIFAELHALQVLRPSQSDLAGGVQITLTAAWDYCCRVLALNYRLTPEMIDALELIDDAAMRSIICATIELPAIGEVRDQKKSSAALTIPVT